MYVQLPTGQEIRFFIEHKKGRFGPWNSRQTNAWVFDQNNNAIGHGSVEFKPHTFNRRRGVAVALKEALEMAGLTRAERKAVWSRVWNGRFQRSVGATSGLSFGWSDFFRLVWTLALWGFVTGCMLAALTQ